MGRRKLLPAIFQSGQRVKISLDGSTRVITDYTHNGYNYMYSFSDTDMRCGEDYLKASEEIIPK